MDHSTGEPNLGQRKTRQRDHIHRVIREAQGPLTVQEIHERAQEEVTGLGIATVYRTINLLLEKDHIHSVILPTGETRYERADLGHHHHFHCRVCDEVFDLDTCPVRITDVDALGEGYVVDSHELTLYGTCPRCTPPTQS